MKKILFFFLFGFAVSFAYAQTDVVAQETYDKILDENEELQKKLSELEEVHKYILDSLTRRNQAAKNSKATEVKNLKKQISELTSENKKQKSNVDNKRNQLAEEKGKIDKKEKKNSSTVSDVEARNQLLVQAFRGAIYYPIRSRYSSTLVTEALKLGPVFSEDEGLKKNFEDYKPMLEKYDTYSEDLIRCLKDCESIAKEFNGKFGKRTNDGVRKHAESQALAEIQSKLTSSLYYKEVYVKVKANPNAISIPYLNNIIKEFEASNSKSKINHRVYAGYIGRLEAKD